MKKLNKAKANLMAIANAFFSPCNASGELLHYISIIYCKKVPYREPAPKAPKQPKIKEPTDKERITRLEQEITKLKDNQKDSL